MSGIRKESTVKSGPQECDEWLTTRNKRKASPIQKPIKKHKASSTPLREITRDNQPFLLTQNSPPPPQLKTCTKQSDIKSFFKSRNQTDHRSKENSPVHLSFEDEDVIVTSDDSDEENFKENLNFCGKKRSRSQNSPIDKGSNFSRNHIHLDEEEFKLKYVGRNKDFSKKYKDEEVIDSLPKISYCRNLDVQNVERRIIQVHKPVHRKDSILQDIHTEKSVLSSKREDASRTSLSSKAKDDSDEEDETDQKHHRLEQKQKFYKEDCEFTETEFSMNDTCLVTANKKSKDKHFSCDRFTCSLCCDSESQACSCGNTSCTEKSTDLQYKHSHLINSEEADQELDNFSLSLNTQFFT